MTTKEEVIKILTEHLEAISSDFDDYLCYYKYGKEKFLKADFKIDEDDRKVRNDIYRDHLGHAAKKISDKGEDAEKILKEIISSEGYPNIKNFASEVYQQIS